ncbi:MAG: hypothetical protein HYT77_08940 [Deltaproteobacteria bacterium]|nr:hypothetical protein [Deltaproteobacteria bacterium]
MNRKNLSVLFLLLSSSLLALEAPPPPDYWEKQEKDFMEKADLVVEGEIGSPVEKMGRVKKTECYDEKRYQAPLKVMGTLKPGVKAVYLKLVFYEYDYSKLDRLIKEEEVDSEIPGLKTIKINPKVERCFENYRESEIHKPGDKGIYFLKDLGNMTVQVVPSSEGVARYLWIKKNPPPDDALKMDQKNKESKVLKNGTLSLKVMSSEGKPVVVDYEILGPAGGCVPFEPMPGYKTCLSSEPLDGRVNEKGRKGSSSRIQMDLKPGSYSVYLQNPRIKTVGEKELQISIRIEEGKVTQKTVYINSFQATRRRRYRPFTAEVQFLQSGTTLSGKAFVGDRWARFELETDQGRQIWGLDTENNWIRMPVDEEKACVELQNHYPTYGLFHEFPGMSEICETGESIDGQATERCEVYWSTYSRGKQRQTIWKGKDLNNLVIKAESYGSGIEFHNITFESQEIGPYFCPNDYSWMKEAEWRELLGRKKKD